MTWLEILKQKALNKSVNTNGVATLPVATLKPQTGDVMQVNSTPSVVPAATLKPKVVTSTPISPSTATDTTNAMAILIEKNRKANAAIDAQIAKDKLPVEKNTQLETGKPLWVPDPVEPVQTNQTINYQTLIDNATAQQRRNSAINTAQTRTLAQEQAMQAGARPGSSDAANYVNRSLASADAANVAGAQGLQDTILAYQKSNESQQNWQKSFAQSAKQADQSNERARYDQILNAIGTDNPEALSYFSKQYLAGMPIDKAYSQTLTQGFATKTAKDKAYEELTTWKPQIDEYKKIQKEQGQVAADNYLKENPVPEKYIPTDTASDAASQSQSVAAITKWADNPSGKAPIGDLVSAFESGNKEVIKKLNDKAIPTEMNQDITDGGKYYYYTKKTPSVGSIYKNTDGSLYYIESVKNTENKYAPGVLFPEYTLVNLKDGTKVTRVYAGSEVKK